MRVALFAPRARRAMADHGHAQRSAQRRAGRPQHTAWGDRPPARAQRGL